MLKSSAEILGEHNGGHLLKSVQNLEFLINNKSINMPNYFINTYFIESKFQRKFFVKFKDTASYKGSLTFAMGKCLWFSVKIKVFKSSLSSP